MITLTIDGADYEVPSSASDTNWSANQVAWEQAINTYADATGTDLQTLSEAVKPAAVVGTSGSGETFTGISTAYGRNVVHKITLGHAAVADAGAVTTTNFTIWTLPAKTRVLRVIADVTAAFTGEPISAVTMKVGSSSGGTQYLLEGDIWTNPIVLGNTQTELGTGVVGGSSFGTDIAWSGTTVVQIQLECVTGTFAALDTGSVTFYIECCTYP